MEDIKKVLNLLFDPEDCVSVGNGPYSSHSIAQESILSGKVTLISPNQEMPTQIIKTSELTHLCINSCDGFRSDKNINKLRTFLLEIDTGSIQAQYSYLKTLNFPYSCIIFSGSKSLHTAIVLEEPLEIKEYRIIYQWLLNIGTLFDTNVRNPSRCIRFPGNIRPETGKEQKLLEIKERVKIEDLLNWLNKYPNLRPKEREEKKRLTNDPHFDRLSPWARNSLKYGIDFSKGRNRTFFALAVDFAMSGYSEDEAVDILNYYFVEEHDFKEREFLTTINSAFKYVMDKK